MADISKITTLDGTEYNIKDATARSLISNLPANNLQNLVDGSSTGSVRGIQTATENENYTIGENAFAEGLLTQASGNNSHAEGSSTIASSGSAHAEGWLTRATQRYSHAEGVNTEASGIHSHAEGSYTIANHASQHVFGSYNIADDSEAEATTNGNYIEIVGNGRYNARSNARTLDWDGNEWLAGGESIGGDLVLRDGNIYLDADQFTLGTTPSENIYPLNRVYFRDANGNHVGQLYHHYLSNGEAGVLIEAKRSINDANVYNTIRLSIDDSGNKTVALSDSGVPFRKALGLGTNGALPITVAQGGTGVTTATKNQVFAAPNGSNGAPSFRALVAADIPTLATSKISGLDTTLNGKVDVAGDTMSGDLGITQADQGHILIKNTQVVPGTTPTADIYTGQLGFRTNTNVTFGWVDHRYTKAKASQIRLSARNNGTGSNVDNSLIIGVDNDGTRTVTMSSAAAWRTGLGLGTAATRDATTSITSGGGDLLTSGGAYTALDGKVSVAGDTMTGNLTMKGASVPIRQATAKVGTTPSSTLYTGMFAAQDSAGTNIGYVRGFFGTDGATGMQFECVRAVSGSNKYHNLSLRMKADGTRQVTVTEKEPWLSGLGLAPTNITSSVTKVTTMPSGISKINTLTVLRAGYLVQVYISVLPTASPPTAWVTIASGLPTPALAPIVNGRYWENSTAQPALFQVNGSGQLQVAWGAGSKNQVATLVYIAQSL